MTPNDIIALIPLILGVLSMIYAVRTKRFTNYGKGNLAFLGAALCLVAFALAIFLPH